MTILRRNVALAMIGLSIFIFSLAVTLNGAAILPIAEAEYSVNFLAIFSVLVMGTGIYLVMFTKRRTIHRRGHHFAHTPGRRG